MNRSPMIFLATILLFGALFGCDGTQKKKETATQGQQQSDTTEVDTTSKQAEQEASQEIGKAETPKLQATADTLLFDGKTLDGWETIEFGGEGDVEIVDGSIHMYAGDPLSGICVTEEDGLPKTNYEIELEAKKLGGNDFFAGVTFPVSDSFCTLVVGGWGGSLVGLSNLDDQDASSNDTKLMKKFEKDRWYAIRVRVLPDRIVGWIDGEKLIDKSIEGVKVSIRGDVSVTTPVGITNFTTSSAFREIKLRRLAE